MKAVIAKKPSSYKVTFDSLLESGAAWLAWIDGANHFESILKGRIPWNELGNDEKKIVQERLKSVSPENQILLNSFYVTMVAGFEEFLRSAIRDHVNQISQKKLNYDQVDKGVLRLNIRESAKLLRRMDSPPDYLAFNEVDLCRGIATCIPGSTKVELNSVALAEIDGLIKLESFMERIVALGKSLSWDYIGGQQVVKEAMKMEKEKPRHIGKLVSEELESVASNRNRIAHMGGHAADVTLQILRDHRRLLRALGDVIDEL